MDDLASQLNQFLNSPEGMQQIQSMAAALGLGQNQPQSAPTPPPTPAAPQFDMSQLMGLLGQMGGGQQQETAPPPIDLNMMMKIQKAMQTFASGNKNVELLRALRPHLSEPRQKRVDDAIKIMQLIQVLPMLKDSGLFGLGGS